MHSNALDTACALSVAVEQYVSYEIELYRGLESGV